MPKWVNWRRDSIEKVENHMQRPSEREKKINKNNNLHHEIASLTQLIFSSVEKWNNFVCCSIDCYCITWGRIESSVIVNGSTLFEFRIYLASTSHRSVGIHFQAILLKWIFVAFSPRFLHEGECDIAFGVSSFLFSLKWTMHCIQFVSLSWLSI